MKVDFGGKFKTALVASALLSCGLLPLKKASCYIVKTLKKPSRKGHTAVTDVSPG